MQHILSDIISNTITSGEPITRVRLPWRINADERRKSHRRHERTRDDGDSIPNGTIAKENDSES